MPDALNQSEKAGIQARAIFVFKVQFKLVVVGLSLAQSVSRRIRAVAHLT